MDTLKSTIFAFQLVKPILQTITHLIERMILEIQFCSVKCTTVRHAKTLSISVPSHQAMQANAMGRLDEKKPLQNAFKRI